MDLFRHSFLFYPSSRPVFGSGWATRASDREVCKLYATVSAKNHNIHILLFAASGLLLVHMCGCFTLFVGAAGGAGTAVWLSGKLTQEFHATYDQTISAAEKALASLNLPVVKKVREDKIARLRSTYTDGKEIWIDIHKVTERSTKVEIRVGAISPDKEAADKILKAIKKNL